MRTPIILLMFGASLANAGWNDYEEKRELTLDAGDIGSLSVEAGAGSLEVTGVDGAGQIEVTAVILIPGADDDEARQAIEKDLVLELVNTGDGATLKGYFDRQSFSWGDSPSVRLDVRVPQRFALDVDDSSGSIGIRSVSGDIVIDDSSGSITMTDVGGSVDIEDSSGSISVEGVGQDISIEDGSGSIEVAGVSGSVTIDDGSGSVHVRDVGADLIIENDGSGSLNYSNISGEVRNDG